MTLNTETELKDVFTDDALRGEASEITAEKLRDFVTSVMAVGGVMYGSGQPIAMTTSWAPLTAFTASSDSKGIAEDFVTGRYTIMPGADGLFAIDVSLGIYSDYAGWIEIAVTRDGSLTPFRKKRTMTAGRDGVFDMPVGLSLEQGDRVGVAVRGSGNATVTMTDGTFRVIRI